MPGTPGTPATLLRIAGHEVRQAWRSRALAALGLAMLVLSSTAAFVGDARFAAEQRQRDRYQALVGEQFATQPDRHPHRVSHYGYLLFRPRAPLGFFDTGVESFTGSSIFLEAHRQNLPAFSAVSQGGTITRFGELTLASVLQLFLPLFVFAVAGAAVTREREAGTLPLLLCQGVSWHQLLWGKLLGALAVAALVAVPGVLATGLWSAWQHAAHWSMDVVVRAGLLATLNVAFLVTCAAIAVCVSATQRTTRGAMVVLVSLWLGLWVVVPRLMPAVAASLHPVPARATFESRVESTLRELGDSHNPDDPVFARFRADTLRQYGVSRIEDLPINYGGLVTKHAEALTSRAYDEHMRTLLDTYQRQGRLVAGAGLVSPYLAVRLASMALAGADLAHQLEFERQAEAYRFALVQALNDLHITEVDAAADRYTQVVNGAPTRQRIDAAFFARLPTFTYRAPDAGWAIRQQALAFVAAGIVLAAVLGAVARAAARGARVG